MKRVLTVVGVLLATFALQPVLSQAEEQYVHGTVASSDATSITVTVMDENNAEQAKTFQLQADTEFDGVENAAALKTGDMVEVFYENKDEKDVITFLAKVEADAGDEVMVDDVMIEAGEVVVPEVVMPEAAAPVVTEAAMPEEVMPAAPEAVK